MKTRIDVERIKELKEELTAFNMLLLEDVDFYEQGNPINVSPEILREWLYTGLNNTDFITSETYKEVSIVWETL